MPGPPIRGSHFSWGNPRDREPRLYEYHFSSYEGLLDLDIPGVLDGNQPAILRERPLILVCTNGRRDACCARWGMPTYMAMVEAADRAHLDAEAVWQTTHVGGHRLAPNVVSLPAGLYYGRVQPEDSQALIEYILHDEILLEKLRGRSCYPPVVQAAEHMLRQETGRLDVGAFGLVNAARKESNLWEVRFRETNNDRLHQLTLSEDVATTQIRQSCGKEKTAPMVTYHLVKFSSERLDN